MTPSIRRWASLLLLCVAIFVARGASAVGTGRKFTPLVPKNPSAQAMIAERNAAAQKLYESFYGTKKVDWRRDPKFMKALHVLPQKVQNQNGGKQSPAVAHLEGLLKGNKTGVSLPSVTSKPRPALAGVPGGVSPSTNFAGFLGTPSYRQNMSLDATGPAHNIQSMVTADVNKDGYPDVITVSDGGDLSVTLNDGKGGFQAPVINKGAEKYITQWTEDPYQIVVGDLNGDGLPDVVVMRWSDYPFAGNFPASSLSKAAFWVYLNQGNGQFSDPTVVYPTTQWNNEQPTAILIEDRDGDGKGDLVVVSYKVIERALDASGNPSGYDTVISVQTMYGNGDGTFKNSPYIVHYTYPDYEVLVPMGGAQFVTLAGTRYLAIEGQAYDYFLQGTAVLFFQDAGGGRGAYTVSGAPAKEVDFGATNAFGATDTNGLTFADRNGDGLPDITLSFGDYYIYGASGTASGDFGSPQMIESGKYPFWPVGWALADVNGDGILDLVDMELMSTQIWLGAGDGTFADPKVFYRRVYTHDASYYYGFPGNHLAVADFDGDGVLDLVETDATDLLDSCLGRISVYKGHGDGTFAGGAPNLSPPDGNADYLYFPVVLDLNGDGMDDVVAGDGFPASWFSTAISDGKGHFSWKTHAIPANENGFQALYISTTSDAYYSSSAACNGVGCTSVGDFNGDGFQDLILSGYLFGNNFSPDGQNLYQYRSFAVALSKGDGTFSNAIPLPTAVDAYGNPIQFTNPPGNVLVADVNGDGKLDIVATFSADVFFSSYPAGIFVALGNGDGTFQTPSYIQFDSGSYLQWVMLKDVNGDGYPDLFAFDGTNYVMVPGSASGFATDQATPVIGPEIAAATNVGAADFDNDGKLDLFVQYVSDEAPGATIVQVYSGVGDGTFTLSNSFEAPISSLHGLVPGDFNGDGCTDLYSAQYGARFATNTSYGGQIMLGNCDGTFQKPQQSMELTPITTLLPGNFTSDGATSLFAYSYLSDLFVLPNLGGTKLSLITSDNSITQGNSVTFTAGVEAGLEHRPVPTGKVNFYDNGTLIAAQPVDGGTANFTPPNLSVGSHVVTISYTGDASFNPQALGPQVAVQVTAASAPIAPTSQPQIEITSPVSSLNMHQGDSQTVMLTLAGKFSYTGTVKLSVAGATNGLNVDVSPSTVSLTNGNSATISVHVTAVQSTAMAKVQSLTGWMGITLGATGSCVFLLVPVRRRKSMWACMLAVLCVTGVCLMAVSCGSSGSSPKVTPTVSTTVVVTATPSVAGATVQTTTFAVTVQ